MSDPPTQPPVKPPVQPPVPKPRAMTKIPTSLETAVKKDEHNSTTIRARSSSDITSSMKRGVTPPTKATFTKPTPTPLPRPHPPNQSKTTTEVKSEAPVSKKETEEETVKDSNEEREEGTEPKRKPRPRRRQLSEDSDSGPDYENIDAHLDDELQDAVNKTDYVNWAYPDSDAEDEEIQYTGVRKMGPSVPLTSHPVLRLRKSQSTTDLDKSTEEDKSLRPVSQQHPRQGPEGPRPKNRAPPPPPPGKRKEREKTQESATDDARPPGHKRSQSDLPGQKHPPSESPQEGSPIARGGTRGSARRPAPTYPAPLPETNTKQPPSTADVKHDGIYATPQKVMKRNVKSREGVKSRASMEEKEDSPKVARDDRIYSKQKAKEAPSPKQDRVYSKPVKGGDHKKQDKQDRQIYSRSPKLGEKDKPEKGRPHKGGEPNKAAVYARPQRGNEQDAVELAKPQRIYDKQDKQDKPVGKESGNIRPKRHAPPPPAGVKKVSPNSSSPETTMSPDGGGGREGGGEEERALSPEDVSGMEVGSSERAATSEVIPASTPPPKPVRQKSNSKGLDSTESPTTNSEHHQRKVLEGLGGRDGKKAVSRGSQRSWEEMLDRMDLFTIELNKEEGKGLGMVIVSGKVRSGDGAVVEGVFVQSILPGSSAGKDGRIQPGDMLVEIGGRKMVNGSLEEAIQRLRNCTISIKLRIGRPGINSSVFANSEDGEEPIYVNELVGPAQKELFIKLEKAEIRIAELEGEKENSEHSLKVFMEEAEEDKKGIQKKMEELRQKFELHKSESQQNITNLTQALATITMDKAKNDKELDRLREQLKEGGIQGEEINALRQQLLEAQEAKKEIERSLETYKAKDQEIITLNAKVSQLETQISQNQQERDSAQSELQQMRSELSSALEKVSALDTRNQEISQELEQLKAQRSQQASEKTAEVELSQRSEELSSAQQELSQSRAEQERLSTQVAELRVALEKEETSRTRLEESLQSQKNSEKSNTADLLEKMQLQAKQITELKDELMKRSTPPPAAGENHEEDDDDEGLGPPMTVMLESSDMLIEKEAELVESVSKHEKPLEETGQTVPTPQAQPQQHEVSVPQNLPESKPKPPKPSEKPKPKLPEKPKPPTIEKFEPSHVNPPEESLSEPERKEISREPQDSEEIPSVTEFDAIRPMKRLDSSTALHKSQMGSHLRRKKPSREYIRSMGSMTDILEGFSMEDLTETDETKKPERVKTPDGSSGPVVKPRIIPRKESPTNESTDPKKPKPMPRAAPRHKIPVPKPETTGMPEASKRPQATPRHRREHSGTHNLEPEIKPSPLDQKVPDVPSKSEADVTPSDKQIPRSTESEPVIDDKSRFSPTLKREHEEEMKVTPKHDLDPSDSHNREPMSGQSPSHQTHIPDLPQQPSKLEEDHTSPKYSPKKEPIKPGRKRSKFQPILPKHSPVLQPKPVKEEPEDKCELPNSSEDTHQPSRVIHQVSKDEGDVKSPEHQDSKLEELMGKDPSELSVKEKALLAQKMLEKRKKHAPPLVPRKPSKPMDVHDQPAANFNLEAVSVHERTKSFDKHEGSPKRVKKILPGAVNIFGSPMRLRSATVSTDEPDTRRESIERSGEHGQYPELHVPMEPLPREDIDAPLSGVKVPPKRPPPPLLKRLSDEKPTKTSSPKQQRYGTPTSDLDKSNSSELDIAAGSSTGDLTQTEDSNPLLQAGVHSHVPSDLNYDNVLEWSSDHVAIWLTKIGLDHHKQIFQNEGIQGLMLFDLDGSRLKGLGMSSHDDRSILKKEVKALKPFADKQKKAVDKKRKEDKKQVKKKK